VVQDGLAKPTRIEAPEMALQSGKAGVRWLAIWGYASHEKQKPEKGPNSHDL